MTYRSAGQRIDGVGNDNEFVRKNGLRRRVEVWSARRLQKVGVSLDQVRHARLIQAIVLRWKWFAVTVAISSPAAAEVGTPTLSKRAAGEGEQGCDG